VSASNNRLLDVFVPLKLTTDRQCLSVVSFNGTKTSSSLLLLVTWATDLSLRAVKYAVGVTLRLLVINISSSSPAINTAAPAMCHNLQNGGRGPPASVLTTPGMLQR